MSRLEELRRSLTKDENVLLAYLFGSQAKGEAIDESDIDVAILLKDESWEATSKLMGTIADALKVGIGRVDIVNLARAGPIVKSSVLTDGVKLVDKGTFENALYEDVINRLPDTRRLLASYLNESTNPIRKEVLISKLMSLDEEVSVLKTHVLNRPADQVVRDPLLKRVLRDSMRVAIESMIDICKHMVASMKLGIAKEYRDYPSKLSERGLLPNDLSTKLMDYTKLRNVIVHRYAEIDFNLLHNKAIELVNIIAPQFRKHITKLIQEATGVS